MFSSKIDKIKILKGGFTRLFFGLQFFRKSIWRVFHPIINCFNFLYLHEFKTLEHDTNI